ncbi:hypothetical protein SYJ56_20395 [Algoriphagus sp. D3-2-R+10]|uniref:hypothetical protein n=1 Tax=Algoriphagus aurantiacus TaxID=3103948 RepID=UPI002B3F64E9|nr:hypothetical protein [Algoriphagus sp. D3-2-R+10]MEB2777687.1 hypothetical protein [Algoriphagus sp. D3-2-R+10]
MSRFLRLSVLILCLLVIVSCGKNSDNDKADKELKVFTLEITDSVQIDYLGEMMLMDYDPKQDKYLLATDEPWEYLEVDAQGKILHHNKFNKDGIDVVDYPVSLGYFNGDVTVFNRLDGYYRFQDSTKVGEISIPYPYQVVMKNRKLGLFELGNKIYYPQPIPESMSLGDDFFGAFYKLPIIEAQDKTTGDTLGVLSLPETSVLFNNQIHGFPIPVYTLDEDMLVLSIGIEPILYVYTREGDQFVYEKTVEVSIPDWIGYTPVPMDNPEQYFNEIRKIRPGSLTNIFVVGDYYLAIYHRGISEEEMVRLDPSAKYGIGALKRDPMYAAIFDKDFNQLATNVPFPFTSNFPMVVNNEGELVVSKVAGLSETEDDGIVLYKLKLIEK